MALSQGLYQKQLQKLSPQQIQLMKLLQVPTAILEERIKEEMEEQANYTIYPNPVSNILNLKCKEYKKKEIVINDMCGRILIKGEYQNNIDVAHLPSGLYTISAYDGNTIWHSKFVKN